MTQIDKKSAFIRIIREFQKNKSPNAPELAKGKLASTLAQPTVFGRFQNLELPNLNFVLVTRQSSLGKAKTGTQSFTEMHRGTQRKK
ncbi:hypothetical protein QUF58_06640 [Anaerolineales bacterium HSG24]|nr:hypothetical protein [Anaerolineales bacterium HSG24]